MRRINLENVLAEMVLIVEHSSDVKYRNSVGELERHAEMEGILVPLGTYAEDCERIRSCMPHLSSPGISKEVADMLDSILASTVTAKMLTVDRGRQHDSWNRWLHVLVDSPKSTVVELYPTYTGAAYGFGRVSGVLTWTDNNY